MLLTIVPISRCLFLTALQKQDKALQLMREKYQKMRVKIKKRSHHSQSVNKLDVESAEFDKEIFFFFALNPPHTGSPTR